MLIAFKLFVKTLALLFQMLGAFKEISEFCQELSKIL